MLTNKKLKILSAAWFVLVIAFWILFEPDWCDYSCGMAARIIIVPPIVISILNYLYKAFQSDRN